MPHDHTWEWIASATEGQSVDTYSICTCGAVLHVYTFAPMQIRHENLHEAGSPGAHWTRGYAFGIARGQMTKEIK